MADTRFKKGNTFGANSRFKVTHGHTVNRKSSRTYLCWQDMRKRCGDPKNKNYKDYGGRGITVCQRWGSFENFLADMGEIPEGMSIDRADNNGNYEPGNCRWATPREQTWNSRRTKLLTFNGKTQPIGIWERELGFGRGTVRLRLLKGVSVESALSTPTRKNP